MVVYRCKNRTKVAYYVLIWGNSFETSSYVFPHTFLAVYVDVNMAPKLHITHTRSGQSEILLRLPYVRMYDCVNKPASLPHTFLVCMDANVAPKLHITHTRSNLGGKVKFLVAVQYVFFLHLLLLTVYGCVRMTKVAWYTKV